MLGDDRMVHRHELGAVGERAFDLHFVHQFRHAVHHLGAAEELAAEIHQLGDRRPSRMNSRICVAMSATASG